MPDSEIQAEAIESDHGAQTDGAPWDRIAFSGPDSWVEEESYDPRTPAKEGAHSTFLLFARQTNAESGQSHHVSAVRLETTLAVQNQSQWKLNLDPRFQRVTMHWLRAVRGTERIDHLRRDRMRLMQRETQLEHHVINGSWTLLVVLDDVRTGDVIEVGFTLENQHPINAGWCEVFFSVPAQFVIGRYRAAVVFLSSRMGMNCRTSPDAPARTERTADGSTWWSWEGAQTTLREPEINTPGSHLDYIWIQVGDLPGWNALAQRVARQWQAAATPAGDFATWPEFARPPQVDAAAVTRLIRHIQDNFRYLSIDLATGGWIPAGPETVARQRRGDCKDLVWLATNVLRSWGVAARPVLVGSGFRKGVATLLPMTFLFNHAVLEVEVGGWARWFDLTARSQGGDFVSQSMSRFGWGLPVNVGADGLREQPNPTLPHQFVLRETILIDTYKGEPSAVEQRLWVNGYHADNLRHARFTQGADGFADGRLKQAEQRYGKARRYAPLQWRDDRENNICEVVETFVVSDIVATETRKRVAYDLPANVAVQFVGLPPDKPRRTPWAVPFPLEIRHQVTVKAASMGNRGWRRRKWTSGEFFGSLAEPRPSGAWSKSVQIIINVPEVEAGNVASYRIQLFDFFKAIPWRLYLPKNRVRPKLGDAFGVMLPTGSGAEAYVPTPDPATFWEAVIGQPPKKHWREWLPSAYRTRWIIWIAWWLIVIVGALLVHTS